MDDDSIEGATQKYAGKAQGAVGDMLGDAKMKTEGVAREASGAMEQAVGTAKDAAASAADNMSEILKKIQAQLADLAGQIKEGAGTAGTVISDRGRKAVTAMGEQVQDAPVTSLMVIGAVGFLLGFMSRRD